MSEDEAEIREGVRRLIVKKAPAKSKFPRRLGSVIIQALFAVFFLVLAGLYGRWAYRGYREGRVAMPKRFFAGDVYRSTQPTFYWLNIGYGIATAVGAVFASAFTLFYLLRPPS